MASAAPVSMFVEPGPTEAVHTQVWSRSCCRAYATEVCTIACSLRARTYGSPGTSPASVARTSSWSRA